VTGFWRARRSRLAEFEFAYWRRQTLFALHELRGCGELTDYGATFAQRLEQTLARWAAEPVPEGADRAAEWFMVARQVGWRLANQTMEPAEVDVVVRAWKDGNRCPVLPAARQIVGAGSTEPPRIAQLARDAWLVGTGPPIAAVRHARAACLAGTADADDWAALAVALRAADEPGALVATQRPEVVRMVADRLHAAGRAPGLSSLLQWLEYGIT
jgi:hypothetical protein